MRLRDVGEFGLIARIERAARRAGAPSWVRVGIGDDAAVLRPRAGEDVVLTTDAFVHEVHFRLANESPRNVGRRALVANLSDLAAMGARPLGCTLALAAPADLRVERLDGIVAGLLYEARAHRCPPCRSRVNWWSAHADSLPSLPPRSSPLRRGKSPSATSRARACARRARAATS